MNPEIVIKKTRRGLTSFTRMMGAASLFAMAAAAHVQADSSLMAFEIPAQPLSKALLAFAEQSETAVVVSRKLTDGLSAPAVSGQMTADQALQSLLDRSGLAYHRNAQGGIVIARASTNNGGATAEDSTADSPAFVLEEIIVTATRREASMQDIPMSIAAYSGDKLKEGKIDNIQDLSFLAAGLDINLSGLGEMRMTLRGISTPIGGPSVEDGVAFHQDGVYLAERSDRAMGFFDIDRIEVLRGPQGTLYGRNATGGAVNVVTKAPTEEFEAGGSATFGNYDLVETEGYASGPLVGDKLMGRIAFKTTDRDGFTPNLYDGDALDDADFAGVRAKLRYEPSADFRLDITADFNRDNRRPQNIRTRGHLGTPAKTETASGENFPEGRAVSLDGYSSQKREAWGLSAKMDWDLGSITATSLTAYRDTVRTYDVDADSGPGVVIQNRIVQEGEQFSQEVTLASNGDSQLEWVGGLFYFWGEQPRINYVPLFLLDTVYDFVGYNETSALSVFGEASYPLVEKLTVTLGGRYSYEKKSGWQAIEIFGNSRSQELEDSWSTFTPKAAVSYAFSDDVSAYLTISRGFKSGGFNLVGTFQESGYEPEEVTNYEVGVKTSLMGGRIRANLSAFYMDYSNLQVSSVVIGEGGVSTFPINNAAKATIQGIEFDFNADLSESFSIDGNVSLLDAAYEEFPNAPQFGVPVDVAGNRLPETAKVILNVAANYTVPVGDWGSATLRGAYAYKSKMFFDPFENPLVSQDAFGMLDARLTFEEADGKWNVALWGKNLTDELIAASKSEAVSGLTGNTVGTNYLAPRTYGITVGYRF